jgi:hypothetical protein
MRSALGALAAMAMLCWSGCGDSANEQLIGAECTSSTTCDNEDLTCLNQFAGGYCGAAGCASNADCPKGSICVTDQGTNFCFLVCTDKTDCNKNRTLANESNCSSNITRVEPSETKACVPPSSGL